MKYFMERNDHIFSTKVYQKIEISKEEDKIILFKSVDLMRDFEKNMSFYNKNSQISKINTYAGIDYVKVSKDIFNVIKTAKIYSELTKGVFDITIAPLVKEWAINTPSHKVLDKNKVDKVKEFVNYKDLILDEDNLRVMLLRKGMKIDLGGIAKGYIADKIIELYRNNGIRRGIINIGGNVKTLGKKGDNKLWNIGIVEPKKDSDENICCLSLEDESLVTSVAYEKSFLHKGKIYHHILDPSTGYPAKSDLKSISVVSSKSIDGDALATPLFIMGKEKASKFMKFHNISGLMITDDDKIMITNDLLDKFKLFKKYAVLSF